MHPCTQCGENIFQPRVTPDFNSLHGRPRSEIGPASIQPDEVSSILKNVELDLQDYEAEMAWLEARALLLISQKERLSQYATRVKAFLSPIRRLPDELLREIFDLSCHMNRFSVHRFRVSSVFDFRTAPAMAISSVCSRWRKSALAMPSIWSRIALDWFMDMDDRNSWREDGFWDENIFPLYTSLARSLSCPLTIQLHVAADTNVNPACPHPIIARLAQHIQRFNKIIFINSSNSTLSDMFLDTASPHFPLLEDLHLHHYFFCRKSSEFEESDFLQLDGGISRVS
ncbi:hypothetical protein D9757_005231 [Collybiopsis confluens]|uniref:F-box domain-containing protein n=1 Tax=Collybiopsis confluens TaxID=2823264 RepID=A0A8H5ME18_9AGAR|nr:hypothetical protein D9757_005231 [Collybiopsis confluens]